MAVNEMAVNEMAVNEMAVNLKNWVNVLYCFFSNNIK